MLIQHRDQFRRTIYEYFRRQFSAHTYRAGVPCDVLADPPTGEAQA